MMVKRGRAKRFYQGGRRTLDAGGPGVYHLLDAVEALAVEAEGLFEQNLVLHRPLVWKRREVGQVGQRLLDVVFVPEEHAQRLDTE